MLPPSGPSACYCLPSSQAQHSPRLHSLSLHFSSAHYQRISDYRSRTGQSFQVARRCNHRPRLEFHCGVHCGSRHPRAPHLSGTRRERQTWPCT